MSARGTLAAFAALLTAMVLAAGAWGAEGNADDVLQGLLGPSDEALAGLIIQARVAAARFDRT